MLTQPVFVIFCVSVTVLLMIVLAIAVACYLEHESDKEIQRLIEAMGLSHRTGLARLHSAAYQFKR